MRYFNTEGCCKPNEHYMVCLDDRLRTIREEFVEKGKYFIINRGRQYGKTTTLMALAEYLIADYVVIHMDFQMMSTASFADEQTFAAKFIRQIERYFSRKQKRMEGVDAETFQMLLALKNEEKLSLDLLFEGLSEMCETAEKPVVLMIDEVDSASNNQVFIDFLAQLRGYYLNRDEFAAFQSVILAGVYDIKNLKSKIRPDEEHQYNSPWNIAANFYVAMNFPAEQIADMLCEYEEDHHTGMNVEAVAEEIYQYTSGYPYLVSAICKIMDEKTNGVDDSTAWKREGILQAVNYILKADLPLFGSMIKHVNEYPAIKKMLYNILFWGESIVYNLNNRAVGLAGMFGYVKEQEGCVRIANRIFETCLYDYFLSEEELANEISDFSRQNKNHFVKGKKLDMDRILERFVEHFTDIYGDNDEKFIETYGRKFFLLYLKPIINGTGNYYIEAQTRDARRTDVIVDYLGEQFVIELKIWHGNEYNERGEQQLTEYLDYYHLDKGYLLSFNFNQKKEVGVKELRIGDKIVVEAVV